MTEMEACEMEQPSPSQPMAVMRPSTTRTPRVTSSPQVGLTWWDRPSGSFSAPAPWRSREWARMTC